MPRQSKRLKNKLPIKKVPIEKSFKIKMITPIITGNFENNNIRLQRAREFHQERERVHQRTVRQRNHLNSSSSEQSRSGSRVSNATRRSGSRSRSINSGHR